MGLAEKSVRLTLEGDKITSLDIGSNRAFTAAGAGKA